MKICMGKTISKRGVNESNKNNSIYKELWIMFILILTEQKKIKESLLTNTEWKDIPDKN